MAESEFEYTVTPEIAAEFMGLEDQPPPLPVSGPGEFLLVIRVVDKRSAPVPGSTRQECSVCREPVWVSSKAPPLTRICTVCHEAQVGKFW